ncbi:undecaprenyl-diphosphate phosphatase [Pleionea sp. CnH1-48]|uniref:undecaprenyl-diphosphate phosphatase n=1 Tax=Pleionea sp. CnH1-48 TaxID=2954494 RepID=UPI0020968AD9|nr:undecaprenyl-diphosphate phosphatase [Pleionea sp. CnH1-48]MCO7225622.1 undecaprenyl-diphosphate phosphatase [Pleionea sp. CnH1-48]
MDWLQIILLALIQGLTEFLPISSSAHLILPAQILGWKDQGHAFDVAVHVGTLTAVLVYFREEVGSMIAAFFRSGFKKDMEQDARLAWAVIWGTVPVGLVGLAFSVFDIVDLYLRNLPVIAATTIIFALLLAYVEKRVKRERNEYQMTWKDVAVVGCCQAFALIPGTSRSGATIMAGLWLGLTRQAAARFSFLLSIPVIILSGGLTSLKLVTQAEPVKWGAMLAGFGIAAVSAFACIHLFLKLIDRIGMMPFVWYRLAMGAVLIGLIIWG